MSDTTKDEPAEQEAEDEAVTNTAEEAVTNTAEEAPEPDNDQEAADELDPEALQAEIVELNDKLLRAMAETENVRRRAVRDRADASKYAIANFAREMVGVADNLNRALGSVEGDARQNDEALDNLMTGVEMTERAMLNAFEGVGIKTIEAEGQRFDHNFHEAMFEVPDPSQPAGTVVQVIEAGYTLGDRLLRPARVGVSKGGPKPEAEETTAEESQTGDATAYEKDAETGTKLDEET